MRVTRIYHHSDLSEGANIKLSPAASSHLIRVLRSKPGTPLVLFNGQGGEYQATLINENNKAAEVEVTAFCDIDRESQLNITLLQCISRSDRMDTTIQKATELGVKTILPVTSERSAHINKSSFIKKSGRWAQIAISACEQSGRTTVPIIHSITDFDTAVTTTDSELKLVLDPTATTRLGELKGEINSLAFLSGPEGGLSDEEIRRACDAGYTGIKLGERVLRTETAAPACIAAVQTLWGDLG